MGQFFRILLMGAALSVGGCVDPGGSESAPPSPADAFAAARSIQNAPTADTRRLLQLINQTRAKPHRCGELGLFPAAPPLSWNASLEASARLTVDAMAADGFFAHVNPATGENGASRISAVGYAYLQWGENLESGYDTAEQAMEAFLASPTHCRLLMRRYWEDVAWYRRATPESDLFSVLGAMHFGRPM